MAQKTLCYQLDNIELHLRIFLKTVGEYGLALRMRKSTSRERLFHK